MSERIPIIIIAGYLGAGKTTLLREIIPQMVASPRVPYVILNDVMNAEVDSALLREVAEMVQPISGGCICCDSAAGLIQELERVPLDIRPMVFIEANGTTDPFPLLELLTLDTVLSERYGPVYQVTVVNQSRWQKRLMPWDRKIERSQAATASHLVTNRSESASLKQQLRVKQDLEDLNPNALRVTPAELVEELFSLSSQAVPNLTTSERVVHGHHHLAVRATPPPMDESTLREWLLSFPPTVLRIKGLVALTGDGADDACFFQRTDDDRERPSLIKTRMPEGAEPCAVFIGNGLDETRIQESLVSFRYLPPTDSLESGFALPKLPDAGRRGVAD